MAFATQGGAARRRLPWALRRNSFGVHATSGCALAAAHEAGIARGWKLTRALRFASAARRG